MAITSASTLAEVIAQYEDSADYDVSNDSAKCKLFIVACRFLLRRNPNEIAHGTGRVRIEPGAIQKELEKAQAWLEGNDTTSVAGPRGYVRYANFRNFRT